jgi:hypothetical protein
MEVRTGSSSEGDDMATSHTTEKEGVSVASGSGGVRGTTYGHDEFERHTREGVRVLDEMSDEEDDRATDDLGGACHLHKDVSTVTPEPTPLSSNEKKIEKYNSVGCMSEMTRKINAAKNMQKPPPPPSAPDAQSDWGKSFLADREGSFPQQYHTIRANRKRVALPMSLGAVGGYERRGGG